MNMNTKLLLFLFALVGSLPMIGADDRRIGAYRPVIGPPPRFRIATRPILIRIIKGLYAEPVSIKRNDLILQFQRDVARMDELAARHDRIAFWINRFRIGTIIGLSAVSFTLTLMDLYYNNAPLDRRSLISLIPRAVLPYTVNRALQSPWNMDNFKFYVPLAAVAGLATCLIAPKVASSLQQQGELALSS